jgi:hypothetical protein
MSLRTRLLLGYGYLVLLIVLAAGGAAVGFFNLSSGIDRILQENVRSLTSAIEMLEALERQDSATLAELVQPGDEPGIRDDLQEADAAFAQALVDARGNVTIEGEEELLATIGRDYGEYTELRQELLSQDHDQPLVAYNQQTHPTFNDVKHSVIELVEMNRAAMVEADREARQTALQNGVWLGVLVTIALLSLIFLSRALHKYLISRLTYFKQVSEAIAEGDHKRRFELGYNDELTSIARHFNAAIDAQEELRSQAQGLLNQQRQLLIGALEQWPNPVALVGLDGSLIASTMDDDTLEAVLGERRWVQTDGRDLVKVHEPGDEVPESGVELDNDDVVRFRLMVAAQKRPVGWIATLERA